MKTLSRSAGWACVCLTALIVLISSARTASAVVTATWDLDSYQNWDEGEGESAFITSMGEVRPGWSTDRTELELEGVWAALKSRDGSVVLGTDDSATIFRVGAAKRGKPAVSKLATIPGVVAVVSLAEANDGTLYAGTMPGGQVWRVNPAAKGEAKASLLVTLPDAETVWALTFGEGGKTLYAGTGPEGKLFAIDVAKKRASVVFETGDKRILSLARGSDGSIWLGTSEQALVFRHDPKAKTTRAMADFAGNEITAMAAWSGGVVVAANDFEEPSTSGMKTKAAIEKAKKIKEQGQALDMPDTGSAPGADKPTPSGAEPARKGARKGKGAVYRVHSDGRLEQLHALTATYVSGVVVTETGRIFAGAGDKGRVYLIDTDDSVSTVFDVEERIVAAMVYDPSQGPDRGLAFATSDASALYRASGRAKQATYTSEVFDAKAPAQFGKLVWHGGGNLRIETRTGNTAEPGVGWSEFQPMRKVSAGGGGSQSGQIASPVGRYMQFQVKFGGNGDGLLRKSRVYYLPQNSATEVTEVEIKGGEVKAGVTLAEGAADPRSPILTFDWDVENPDSDSSEYRVEVRRDGEALWRPLTQEPLTATLYRWNTETFQDGYYRVRITASDRRANTPDRAREHQKTSPLFLVDNQRPSVTGLRISYPRATARATDAMSAIAEMAFSVDGGPWQVGATDDSLFDDLTENLRIDLSPDLPAGIHTLAIRVADEAGNLGAASVTFEIK